jgi:hypothetical protein
MYICFIVGKGVGLEETYLCRIVIIIITTTAHEQRTRTKTRHLDEKGNKGDSGHHHHPKTISPS